MNSLLSSLFDDKNEINNLDSETFDDMIRNSEDCIVLDVRTIEEYQQARIPNSVLIDFYQNDFIQNLKKLEMNKSYFVYCRSGNRSYHTAKKMQEMGFEKVYNLKNGIIEWKGKIESK